MVLGVAIDAMGDAIDGIEHGHQWRTAEAGIESGAGAGFVVLAVDGTGEVIDGAASASRA